MSGMQQSTDEIGQLELEGFLGSILGGAAGRLVGGIIGGKTGRNIGGAIGKIGGGFLPLSAGPGGEQPTDMELQGFWNVLKKIGKGVQTGLNVGHDLGIFSAGQPGMQAAVEQPPTDMELQGFWNVLKKIGKGAQTGLD
ncbi:hypothetical protein ACQR14_33000, partial [Bradyrhizobium oligotrophicum]